MKDVVTGFTTAGSLGRASAYARLVRIEHALFSLPMFVSGALMAGRESLPGWLDWLWIAVAGTAARNLALALNRLIDRHIDAANPRTANRELPAGRLTSAQVISFMALNLVVYGAAAWLIAPICFYLAWIPIVVFVLYPYLKRVTPLCHFGVGAGLALAPLGGYLAAAKSWPIAAEAWLLALFTWLWVGGFDIVYAQLDVESDRRQGILSLPVYWGARALRVAGLMHLLAWAVLVLLWRVHFERSPWLWLPIGLMGLLFALQHRYSARVEFSAFRVNTLVGFVLLAFVVVGVMV
jgi:4-hydroxybenzoate polyprenyltransferase